MCAAVIVVAVVVLMMRRRRGGDQTLIPVEERRGAATGLADEGSSGEVADARGLNRDTREPGLGAFAPASLRQAAESQASGAADPELSSKGPGTVPDEPMVAAGAATMGERIGAFYEEADRPVADYLAARGWTGEPGKPGQEKDADAAPGPHQATAGPGTPRKQLAA